MHACFEGKVRFWNLDRGFGFIIRTDGKADIFAHIRNVLSSVDGLSVGDKVTFHEGTSSRTGKLEATQIRLIDTVAPRSVPVEPPPRPAWWDL
jgi:CspA family cold shock protein